MWAEGLRVAPSLLHVEYEETLSADLRSHSQRSNVSREQRAERGPENRVVDALLVYRPSQPPAGVQLRLGVPRLFDVVCALAWNPAVLAPARGARGNHVRASFPLTGRRPQALSRRAAQRAVRRKRIGERHEKTVTCSVVRPFPRAAHGRPP